jgi:double-stranded uracil-DNA glycosylase
MTVSPPTDTHNRNAEGPDRRTACWQGEAVVRFSRAELESFRGTQVPDLVGPGTRLLFVGINPGLRTAATQTHFGNPVNRFYPALLRAGILEQPIDVTDPMTEETKASLLGRGIGISNLVRRATARADELTAAELREGADLLGALVEQVQPRVVAVLGVTAYRTAFRSPRARTGRQREGIGPAELWVVPNPSGLNAHETVDSLAVAYADPARAAGIIA